MNFSELSRKYKNMTAAEIIESLEKEYADNADAMEDIARAKNNIAYIESQTDYKGQTPVQCALELAGQLSFWN